MEKLQDAAPLAVVEARGRAPIRGGFQVRFAVAFFKAPLVSL
jgi:hypothetical protein